MRFFQNLIIRNGINLLFARFFYYVFVVINVAVIAWFYSISEFALIMLVLGLGNVFYSLLNFGSINLIVKRVSVLKSKNKLIGGFYVLKLLTWIILFTLSLLSSYFIETPLLRNGIIILVFFSIFEAFKTINVAVFRGLEKLKYESMIIICQQIVTTLLLLYVSISGYETFLVFIVYGCGSFIAALIGVLLLKISGEEFCIPGKYTLIELFNSSIPFGIHHVLSTMSNNVHLVVLYFFASSNALAMFSAAQKLFMMFVYIPYPFIVALYPKLSIFFKQDFQELLRLYKRSFLSLMIVGCALGVFLFTLAPILISFLYGVDYAGAVNVLRVLSFILVWVVSHPLHAYLMYSMEKPYPAVIGGVSLSFGIFLSITLVKPYGAIGAAIALLLQTLIHFSIYTIISVTILRKQKQLVGK